MKTFIPIFKHDCRSCIYLGISTDGKHDLYYCEQGGAGYTLIARFSDTGRDYKSGAVFADIDRELGEARTLSKKLGLIKRDIK